MEKIQPLNKSLVALFFYFFNVLIYPHIQQTWVSNFWDIASPSPELYEGELDWCADLILMYFDEPTRITDKSYNLHAWENKKHTQIPFIHILQESLPLSSPASQQTSDSAQYSALSVIKRQGPPVTHEVLVW